MPFMQHIIVCREAEKRDMLLGSPGHDDCTVIVCQDDQSGVIAWASHMTDEALADHPDLDTHTDRINPDVPLAGSR